MSDSTVNLLFDRLIDRGFTKGDVVISTQGHDQGRIYVVTVVEGAYLFLIDGAFRPVSRPKKKKNRHVRGLGVSIGAEKLNAVETMTVEAEKNARIRELLKTALEQGRKE